VYTGAYTTVAFSGHLRGMGEADVALNRYACLPSRGFHSRSAGPAADGLSAQAHASESRRTVQRCGIAFARACRPIDRFTLRATHGSNAVSARAPLDLLLIRSSYVCCYCCGVLCVVCSLAAEAGLIRDLNSFGKEHKFKREA
jgi:hypothetical protein